MKTNPSIQTDRQSCSPREAEANGHLIAAAPELFEALRRLAYDAGGNQDNPLIRHKTLESIERANAAIANAAIANAA